MRTLRLVASGLALVALYPAMGWSQSQPGEGRGFKDSWFWGAKTGLLSFSTVASGSAWAPLIGADWLITRSRGALYVSLDQAFFDERSALVDQQGNVFEIGMRDMRRFTVAALAFPVRYGGIRPYAGLGLSMNFIQSASTITPVDDPATASLLREAIDDQKDRASIVFMGGAQWQYRRFSLFGQATYMPSRDRFLLNDRSSYLLEGGIRVNLGTSIERPK
jgi:hypothetical protein